MAEASGSMERMSVGEWAEFTRSWSETSKAYARIFQQTSAKERRDKKAALVSSLNSQEYNDPVYGWFLVSLLELSQQALDRLVESLK